MNLRGIGLGVASKDVGGEVFLTEELRSWSKGYLFFRIRRGRLAAHGLKVGQGQSLPARLIRLPLREKTLLLYLLGLWATS